METNVNKQQIADAAANISKDAARVSAGAAKVAASEEMEVMKSKAAQAVEKVKDFTADTLESGANAASNLADKLRH